VLAYYGFLILGVAVRGAVSPTSLFKNKNVALDECSQYLHTKVPVKVDRDI
jgi:hypothetical protein